MMLRPRAALMMATGLEAVVLDAEAIARLRLGGKG